ncbi:hypothetical protein C2S52_008095 [Perilla frutescens var. hirtella]|nr:hypothetical protein C2S52_008095 [Perilla frutescens var. hirtella]
MRANNFKLKPLTVELPLNKTEIPTATVTEAEAAASSTCAAPPWTELPQDVTANILQRLGAEEILQSAQKVCATWWKICQNPAMWRVINIINSDRWHGRECTYNICRSAVDRSQGQLIDLTIEYFGDAELLDQVNSDALHSHAATITIYKELL